MKSFFIPIVLLFSNIAFCDVKEEKYFIYFDQNVHTLNINAQNELKQIQNKISSLKNIEIEIVGHTNEDGDAKYNIGLSNRRAKSAEVFLKSLNDSIQIKTKVWKGESMPMLANSDSNARHKNRRVEIRVKQWVIENMEDAFEKYNSDHIQSFELNSNGITKIIAEEGSIIKVPEDAFVDENGKAIDNKDVELKIQECIDFQSWLANNLTTQSENKLLESGGMIKIEAFANDKKLNLAKGKELDLSIPFKNGGKDMSLFYAKDTTGSKDWVQDSSKVNAQLTYTDIPYLKIDTNAINALIEKFRNTTYQNDPLNLKNNWIPPHAKAQVSKPRMPNYPVLEEIPSGFFVTDLKKIKINALNKFRIKRFVLDSIRYEARLIKYKADQERIAKSEREYQANILLYSKKFNEKQKELHTAIDENTKWVNDYLGLSQAYALRNFAKCKISNPNSIYILMDIHRQNQAMDATGKKFNKDRDTLFQGFLHLSDKKANPHIQYNPKSTIVYMDRFIHKDVMKIMNDASVILTNERIKKGYASDEELRGYFRTALKNLSWINIDRFCGAALTASIECENKPQNAFVGVFIKDLNSMMSYYQGLKLPENKNIILVSYYNQDGKVYLAKEEILTKENNTVKFKYVEGSLDMLANLGK
jgi:hypothetical protein